MEFEKRDVSKGENSQGAEVRTFLDEFVMKRNNEVTGIKTDSDGVYVPEEILKNEGDSRETVESLSKYVRTKNVKSSTGKFPVIKETGSIVLPTVEELKKAPELGVVGVENVSYDVATRRALIPLSEEALDDAEGLKEEVGYILNRAIVDTENSGILTAVNNNTDIKTVDISEPTDFIGIGLKKRFQKQFLISTSVYNKIARMKDKNTGLSVLHADLTKPLAQQIVGKNVVVLDDDLVGEDFAIFGDLSKSVILFKRKQVQVKWKDYEHYGQCFQPVVRQDVKVYNPDAIVKLNIVEETTEPVEPEPEV